MITRAILERLARDITPDLAHRDAVVLAPHPDDDVLGCGAAIAHKRRHGRRVRIVYLTDGRAGIPDDPSAAAAIREREAREGARRLGVDDEGLSFLGYPDGRLAAHVEEAAARLRPLIAGDEAVDVFAPYRREFHADHRAAAEVARSVLPAGARLYETLVWFAPWMWGRLSARARAASLSHLTQAPRLRKLRAEEASARKRHAMAAHASQVAAFARAGQWGTPFLEALCGPVELYLERT